MANITEKPSINLEINITLTEPEIMALCALTEYGTDSFIKMFYDKLGKCALVPHENGLRSFLETVKKEFPKSIRSIREARDVFSGRKEVKD